MGKFKSSGIIISTGTGSSGWLYSARQITPTDVSIIQKIMGNINDSELVSNALTSLDSLFVCFVDQVNENLSAIISSKNVFPQDSDQLYYFVREGYVCDAKLYTWRAEGFCKKVRVISEMINGGLQIDGYFKYDIGIGDIFTVSSNPNVALKCIQFLRSQ